MASTLGCIRKLISSVGHSYIGEEDMKEVRRLVLVCLALATIMTMGGCKKFLFFDMSVPDEENPRLQKKMPQTTADLFEAPKVTESIPNPDQGGAFNNWATCLIMFKEGHPHGGDKLHGNFVYPNAPWKQEEFVVIHNTSAGIKVKVDKKSTVTALEASKKKEGPDYIRIIGGRPKLWGVCLYFFDKNGERINDKILEHSSEYQIFFSISDLDTAGQPYEVMDVRYRGGKPIEEEKPIPSKYFSDKPSFEQRSEATPAMCTYVYRDTWLDDDMADGVQELFNIRLFPPFTKYDYQRAQAEDTDCVGLKGHIRFDYQEEAIDPNDSWPLNEYGYTYSRGTGLLPQFFLAIRVMKCPDGKKQVVPFTAREDGSHRKACSPFYKPDQAFNELFRMNIPIKVYTNSDECNFNDIDSRDPYFFHLGREIGITHQEAYDAVQNLITHNEGASTGFGAWFL